MIWKDLSATEKTDLVRDAVEVKGLTYAMAALELGASRVAIAGVVSRSASQVGGKIVVARLLVAGGKVKRPRRKPRDKDLVRIKRYRPFVAAGLPEGVGDWKPARADVWDAVEGSAPIAIEHHTNGCRWPINADLPFFFCNSAVREGSSYCPHHHAIAYREKPPIVLKKKKPAW